MKLSKKSRYGITALIDLSIHSKKGHVALSSIAERNAISPQYLEQIFANLRRAQIIKSIKGAQGGYLLNKPAKEISMAEIIEALDGTYHIEEEQGTENTQNPTIALVIQNNLIDRITESLDRVLLNSSLADLENEYQSQNEFNEQMYYI